MPLAEIIPFPTRSADVLRLPEPSEAPVASPPARGPGCVTFAHMDDLDEAGLIGLLAPNGITSLLDMRPVAVFARPRFRHRYVVGYLYDHGVRYLEYAMMTLDCPRKVTEFSSYDAATRPDIERALAAGHTLVVYDGTSRERGWMDEVRRSLRLSAGFRVEVHPRALVGWAARA
jgi:hypothetical protein